MLTEAAVTYFKELSQHSDRRDTEKTAKMSADIGCSQTDNRTRDLLNKKWEFETFVVEEKYTCT